MKPRLIGASLVALTMALAGCVGDFEVNQTEPFRVQIEDEGQDLEVREDDAAPKRVIVENTENVETVEVEVTVTKMSTDAVTVIVNIEDPETNETLVTREIAVGGNETPDDGMDNGTGNGTGNETDDGNATDDGGDTVTQVIVLDVKGKDNFVVVTQAQEGDANVTIDARDASGQGSSADDTQIPYQGP